jgi:hypothetical protein
MLAAIPIVGTLPGAGAATSTVGMLPANADTESRQVSVTIIKNRFILRSPSGKLEKMQQFLHKRVKLVSQNSLQIA